MIISRAALKWTIIAVFFCIFFGELSAQQVTIKGSVKDGADNSPLAGCTYGVPAEGVGGITDDEGKFMLKVSRKAEVSMIFRSMGYADSMIVIKIVPGKNLYVVDMVMGDNGEGGVVFKDVVFTAGRHAQDLAKVTGSMELVSSEKVDLQATNDVEDVLATTPGVDIIDGQPNIRGSSGYAYGVGSRVLLMLNGLPLLSPAAGSAQFDLVPVDNINQIEIMKGASSVLYGSSALGGVINVLTSDAPDTAKTSIRLVGAMYGSPKDPRLDWDGNKGARDASLNIFHSRKIKNADLTLLGGFWKETGFREGAGSKQGRLMVMTKFRPKSIPGLNWGVNASYRFDSASTFLFWDSYLPGDSVITFAGDTVFNSKGAYSGANSRRRQFNDRVTLDPFVKYLTAKNNLHYWRGRVMGVRNTNDTQQSNSSQLIYSDYQFTTRLWKDKATGNARLTWVTGLTGRMTFANGDSLYGDTRVDTLSCDSIGNCKTDTALIGGHYLAANGAIYSQMDAELTARLTASVGLRYDYWYIQGGEQYGNKIEQAPIFRAGLNYNAFTGNNIRASIGQAFRSPSVAERFTSTSAGGLIIEPNPDIKVEKGYSAEIGMRQGFRTGNKKRYILGYLDVAGFLMDYNNMIEFGLLPGDGVITNIKARFSARNVADARISGIETTTLFQAGYDKWFFSFSGGVTRINPQNLNPVADSQQVDLLNTIGPQDEAFNFDAFGQFFAMTLPDGDPRKLYDNPSFLKYRSKWLVRFSSSLGFGRFNFTTNFRYKSNVEFIDEFLFVAIPGTADWVKSHNKGFTLVDMILSADLVKGMKLSLNVDNVFNEEWAELPGIIGKQRAYSMQLKYVF